MSKPKRPDLDPIYEAAFPLVILPFNGQPVSVRLRELSGAQVFSVGDVSLIETLQDKIRAKQNATIEEINKNIETQNNLCKLALVKPTYQEIMVIMDTHINTRDVEKELAEIKKLFMEASEGPEKAELKNRYNIYEIQFKFLLPADFMAAIINYSLKVIDTDIKKVTEETLLAAAQMATQGHDNPADHLPGRFTDFNREDINRRGWAEYYRWKDKQKDGNR